MNTAQFTCSKGLGPSPGLFVSLALFFPPLASYAAVDGATKISGDETQTVYLEQRDGNEFLGWNVPIERQSQLFPKEPELSGRKVVRGAFRLDGSGESLTPFIWDYQQGKLYLDLNQNRDLSDDPAGVFSCSGRYARSYQEFTNLHLAFKSGSESLVFPVDIRFYGNGPNELGGAGFSLRAFWASQVSLQGRQFEMGYVPAFAGRTAYLVLRPWEQRGEPLSLGPGAFSVFEFCPNLFVGTNGYRLDVTPEQQNGNLKYKLALRDKPVETGELKLEGTSVRKLVLMGMPDRLAGGRFLVLLEDPSPVVRIPAGTYRQSHVLLEAGGVKVASQPVFGAASGPALLTISSGSDKAATLRLGGPLTNSVSVSRRGSFLVLNYQLTSADGLNYALLSTGPAKPPRFSISRAGQVIHKGVFEFG